MSHPEEDKFSVSEEFQIVDASCFGPTPSKPDLEFHLNFPCPVCGSFQSHFICAQCVNSGSFTSSRRSGNVTYAELSTRLSVIISEIQSVNQTLSKCGLPKTDSSEELELLIKLLNSSIDYHKKQNKKKHEQLHRINRAILRCRGELKLLKMRNGEVLRGLTSIKKERLILSKQMASQNCEIESWHIPFLKELLTSFFPVNLMTNKQAPDEFVRAALLIDRVNAFVGPEPICSSQIALTHCVPVIHTVAELLGVWLPPVLVERLRLSGPLLTNLPQRDTLGHIYSTVLHAIHLLCACRLIDVRNRMERLGCGLHPGHSEYNPLLGLFCLGRAEPLQEFSGPYQLKLDGLFGMLPPPDYEEPQCSNALRRLRLDLEVEQGQEAKELEGTDEDRSGMVESSVTNSTTVLSALSDLSPTTGLCPSSRWTIGSSRSSPDQKPELAQPENWELVTDGSNLPSVDTESVPTMRASDTWTRSLSALWRNPFYSLGSDTPEHEQTK